MSGVDLRRKSGFLSGRRTDLAAEEGEEVHPLEAAEVGAVAPLREVVEAAVVDLERIYRS